VVVAAVVVKKELPTIHHQQGEEGRELAW